MPYRYSAAEARAPATETAPPGDQRRPSRALGLLAGVLALGGTASGIVATLGGPSGVARGAAAAAVKHAFVAANVLEQNLGAPAPEARSPASEQHFALVSHERSNRPEAPAPLTPTGAERLLVGQGSAIKTVFSGHLLVAEQHALTSLVAGELGPDGAPVGSGGASVRRWLSVSITGRRARAEALVDRWEVRFARRGHARQQRLVATWAQEEVDALATLVRTGSGWRVVTLAAAPWQEPT